ncbi:unnamed protein product [Lactuca virosa]|uniref:Uncharacterized protein n=1 Tax=Lactuca virosa TaxID=75947 RepID=A0AAU9PRR8_9ASTR|nr:unnamed protein product [Lactuca virosa]
MKAHILAHGGLLGCSKISDDISTTKSLTKPGGIANMVISQMPLYCSTRCKHKGFKHQAQFSVAHACSSKQPGNLLPVIYTSAYEVNNNRPKESNNDLPVTWNTTEGGFRKRK